MPKLFSESTTQHVSVLDSSAAATPSSGATGAAGDAATSPHAIVLNLTQHYVFKGNKTPEKTVNSKITLKLDGQGMIEHHEEEWDHEKNKTGEDGFMGKLQEWRKKADAKMVEVGRYYLSQFCSV